MMTDITAILPATHHTPRQTGAEDTYRASRLGQEADRQAPVERADGQQTGAVDGHDIRHNKNTDEHGGSFEETLKKRLEKDDVDKSDNKKDNTDPKADHAADPPVAVATPVLETIRRSPIVIKSINPNGTSDTPQASDAAAKPLVLKAASSEDEGFDKLIKKGLAKKDPTAEAVATQNKTASTSGSAPSAESSKETVSARGESGSVEKSAAATEKTAKDDKTVVQPAGNKDGLPVEKPQSKTPTSDDKSWIETARNEQTPRTAAGVKEDGQTPKPTGEAPTSSLKQGNAEFANDKEAAKEQTAVKATETVNLNESASTHKTASSGQAADSLTAAAAAAPQTTAAPAAATQAAEAAVKPVGETAAMRPIDQIVQTLQQRTFGADAQVRMTLAPEELGAIRMTFRQDSGGVVGVLEVQRNETRREVEQSIGQLTASMENAGVQVRRIEVVPWSSGNPSSRNDTTGSDADAAARQQMDNQPDGRHSSRRNVHDETGNNRPAAAPPKSPYRNDAPSDAGLNIYL